MQVVLLAGGVNTTPEITADMRPKCLWPVANRPCVQYALERLKAAGASEFIFCLTDQHESVKHRLLDDLGKDYNIQCAVQEHIHGTAGAVKDVADRLMGPFVVAHSAIALDGDLRAMLAAHRDGGAIMTVGGVQRAAYPSYIEELQRDRTGRVTGFSTCHWSAHEVASLYPCGLYVFDPACLEEMPDDRYFDIKEQLIPQLVENDQVVLSHEMDGYWREIHTLNDYFHLNMDLLIGYVENPLFDTAGAPCDYVERQGDVRVADSVRIIGPLVLGEGCELGPGAQVFGPCVIGKGAHIGRDAVVSNSVLLDGAAVGDQAYVHGSILAERSRVGQGERLVGISLLSEGSRTLRQAAYPSLSGGGGTRGGGGIRWRRLIKRAFDIVVGALAIMLVAPLMAAVALLVKVTSPGPVIYTDYRCTVNGRRFPMFKFRTMRQNADELRVGLGGRNEADGPTFKMSHDPRTTRLGRLLRRTSMDELPQLFNVLRGEMSLVGPRPLRMNEMRYHRAWRDQRLSVVPGVTGPWQVAPDNKRFRTWISQDVGYAQGATFWRDLAILGRTFFRFSGNGEDETREEAAPRGAVLCYHAVEKSDTSADPYGIDIDPQRFSRQMTWLARRGLIGASLSDFFAADRPKGDGGSVAVTFDDGYKSVIEGAYPVLEQHGFKATVFVVVERVGSSGVWVYEEDCGRERTFMDWDEIRRLADAGWTIGSHTMTHASLVELPDDDLLRELAESRSRIEGAIGRPVDFVSYPFGHVDQRVEEAAREAGYRVGLALGGRERSNLLCTPRTEIKRQVGTLGFRLKVLRAT